MEIAIIIVFIVGYIAITLEHNIHLNKAASALMTGVLCWTLYILGQEDHHLVTHELMEHLGEISGILFFLLGAMTIVELIDAHEGFQVIKEGIKTRDARKLLWLVGIFTFFLSAILDNLTTTIVIVSLLRKIISDKEQRLFFAGITVIAANAGGAWSPLGDVTTTMLWIGGQVSAGHIVTQLILPSIVCLVVPLIILSFRMKGVLQSPEEPEINPSSSNFERNLVLGLGVGALLFVPIFKTLTHLPPFMAMLMGLGIMWAITELIHSKKDTEDKKPLSVAYALQKIDTPSILFFLGILISISALQSTGQLRQLADWLTATIQNDSLIVMTIGLLSSVVDNVPLVAAAQGMYTLEQYPTDHFFWVFLAYATGTGGSALIIGSAAGVAAMGMEKIEFFWYLKRISWLAVAGYFAGAGVYLLQNSLIH
ncbi:MAG: sodium:proton antiporter [Bacteroidetes bacterium]|nr:MAG: sodium:proton antiporter [Bacteroidota bacterium]